MHRRRPASAPSSACEASPSAFPASSPMTTSRSTFVAGEVHVLLGENGAGKSTLIGMLSGLQQPDDGEILVAGRPVTHRLAAPRARARHRHRFPALHAGADADASSKISLLGGALVAAAATRAALAAASASSPQLLGIAIDPDARVGSALARRAAAGRDHAGAWRGEPVLILDEPTSMLTPQGRRGARRSHAAAARQRRRHRLHHPQAAGGAAPRRPHLGAAPGPHGRRDRAGAAARADASRGDTERSSA